MRSWIRWITVLVVIKLIAAALRESGKPGTTTPADDYLVGFVVLGAVVVAVFYFTRPKPLDVLDYAGTDQPAVIPIPVVVPDEPIKAGGLGAFPLLFVLLVLAVLVAIVWQMLHS